MHGRLGADEKEAVMQRFKDGQIKILVSTTVIEVGVDVPNASVMVVEQAERFGLAQLHQLRGRVGRGAAQSYCLLVTEKMNDTARERIRTLVESTDGFYISEMDLKLRGPGEFFGTKQSGLPSLRIANILRDTEILEIARRDAVDFVARPPAGRRSAQRRGLHPRPLAAPLRPGDGGLMRVIAGEFRSRRLKSIPGDATRPTPDRVREALFNILQTRIAGASFVDAYAGTGAVGIEALSRGAAHAWFLERDRRALDAIRKNLGVARARNAAPRSWPGRYWSRWSAVRRASCSWIRPTIWRTNTPARSNFSGVRPPALTIAQHSVHLKLKDAYGGLHRTRMVKHGDNALSFYTASAA